MYLNNIYTIIQNVDNIPSFLFYAVIQTFHALVQATLCMPVFYALIMCVFRKIIEILICLHFKQNISNGIT